MTRLYLSGTNVEGTPSMSLIERCKSQGSTCIFTPARKMCGPGQQTVGLKCEPCENCGGDGKCLYGMDERDYFCEKCPFQTYKLGSSCKACYAGDATVLIASALGVVAFLYSLLPSIVARKSPGEKKGREARNEETETQEIRGGHWNELKLDVRSGEGKGDTRKGNQR